MGLFGFKKRWDYSRRLRIDAKDEIERFLKSLWKIKDDYIRIKYSGKQILPRLVEFIGMVLQDLRNNSTSLEYPSNIKKRYWRVYIKINGILKKLNENNVQEMLAELEKALISLQSSL